MKILFSIFTIALGILLLSADCGFSQEEQRLPVKLICPRYDISKPLNENFDLIKKKGFSLISSPGKPMLPYKTIEVLLPGNAVLSSVKLAVDSLKSQSLPNTHTVNPAPRPSYDPKHTIGDLADLSHKYPGDIEKVIYGKNSLYPENPILLVPGRTKYSANGQLLKYSRILFTPLQFNPISKKLHLTESANLTLSYRTEGGFEHEPFRLDRPANYVIVTTNRIKANSRELYNFVHFKKRQGYAVRVITENDFERKKGPHPNGRAEKIRQWLVENWQTLGIEYVLLIGNPEPDDPMYSHDIGDEANDPNYMRDDYIPMKQIWHALSGRGEGRPPFFQREAPLVQWGNATDWYYADLTGNWDADGDGFYGESPWLSQSDVETSTLPAGIDLGGFSVRWKKTITLSQSRCVTLKLKQWEGARVYIGDKLVVNHWPHTMRKSETEVTTFLKDGNHKIIIEYYQKAGHGHILAQIDLDSDGPLESEVLEGFQGEYYSNPNLQGQPAAVVNSETLWKNWETSDYVAGNPGPDGYGLMGGVDLDAEVSVGRIPVYENDYGTLDKILVNIRKGVARDVHRKILLPMRKLDDNSPPTTPAYDLGEAIVNDIVANEPGSFSAYRIYDEDYSLNPPPESTPCEGANVVDGWNQGFGLVTWLTHGRWRFAGGVLDVKIELPQLRGDFRPLVFAASCHNGNIYLPDCYPDCAKSLLLDGDGRMSLGYSLLREVASAVVSSSEVSTHDDQRFNLNSGSRTNQNFAYHYVKEIISNRSSTGDALKNLKYSHFNDQFNLGYYNYHQQLIYNLFGDPSLYLRPQYGIKPPTEKAPDLDIIFRDFVPDLCQYLIDCPPCLRSGNCDFVSFSIGPLNELFSADVRKHDGEIVASSLDGNSHDIKFQYDSKAKYALVLKPVKKEGFRERLKNSFPQMKFTQ